VNDRGFRLDFFIAVAAVLISAITAAALIYQTRVIGDQFAATIWPYLSIGATYGTGGETIEVTNDGVGPALVQSAQLFVDGRAVRSWNDYVKVLTHDPELRKFFLRALAAYKAGRADALVTMSSIGPSSTLPAGATQRLLRISLPEIVPPQALVKHSVAMDFCYCSLNGSCWTLHATTGQINGEPAPVSHCSGSAAIQSHAVAAAVLSARPVR
jgi:hypothetical protein